jgi:nitric oxide reductase large subunit
VEGDFLFSGDGVMSGKHLFQKYGMMQSGSVGG